MKHVGLFIAGAAAALCVAGCGGEGGGNFEPVEAEWELADTDAAAELDATELNIFPGAEHCGWETAHFLELRSEDGVAWQFVRDPDERVRTDPLPESFAAESERPDDATWTGWSAGDAELWIGPEGDYAYLGTGDDSERWGATPYIIGCD